MISSRSCMMFLLFLWENLFKVNNFSELFCFISVVLVDICVNVNTLFKKYSTLGHSELQKSQCKESNLLLIFHYRPNLRPLEVHVHLSHSLVITTSVMDVIYIWTLFCFFLLSEGKFLCHFRKEDLFDAWGRKIS